MSVQQSIYNFGALAKAVGNADYDYAYDQSAALEALSDYAKLLADRVWLDASENDELCWPPVTDADEQTDD